MHATRPAFQPAPVRRALAANARPRCIRPAGWAFVLLAGVAGTAFAAPPSTAPTTGTEPTAGGLSPRAAASAWPSWQIRALPSVQERGPLHGLSAGRPSPGGALGSGIVADVYLSSSGLGPRVEGGFRATSGLIESVAGSGNGLSLRGRDTVSPLPYLGIGYGGWVAGSGFSVQADLGLVASSGAVRLGRSLQSAPPVDELIRDLRLAPVLRLGVSYAF